MTDDLELRELEQFHGTEQYHYIMGASVTDGIAYIMRNGYSWFVTDALVVIKMKLKEEDFLAIKLELNGSEAKMIITDGNEKELYAQNYKWTNAKKELTLYFTNGVLLLSSEY